MNSKISLISLFTIIIVIVTSCKKEENLCATESSTTMLLIKHPDAVGIVTECHTDSTSTGGYTVGAIEKNGNTITVHGSETAPPCIPSNSMAVYENPEIFYHSLGFTLVDSTTGRQTIVKIPLGSSPNSCAYQIMDQIIHGLN